MFAHGYRNVYLAEFPPRDLELCELSLFSYCVGFVLPVTTTQVYRLHGHDSFEYVGLIYLAVLYLCTAT